MPEANEIPFGAATGFQLGDLYPLALMVAGAVLLAAVVALSQQRDRAFSAAIVYLVIGALVSIGLQALGTDLVDPFEDAEFIEHAAEFAVIVALFSAGIRLDRPLDRRSWRSTIRLIGIAMPLTIAAVALFAGTVMGLYSNTGAWTIGPAAGGVIHRLNTTLATNGAGALTLLNGPAGTAGDPTGYITININGTNRVIPFW